MSSDVRFSGAEAKHEHLKRYLYDILNISPDDVIEGARAIKYVQAIRKADPSLTMMEQDIALSAYLAGMMGGSEGDFQRVNNSFK